MCVHFVLNKIKNLLRFALHNIKNDRRTLSLRTLSFFYLFHFHGVSHWCWHSAAMKEVDLLFLRRVKYTRKWKQHYAGPSIACIVSNKPFCSDYCVLCVGYRPKTRSFFLFFISFYLSTLWSRIGLSFVLHLLAAMKREKQKNNNNTRRRWISSLYFQFYSDRFWFAVVHFLQLAR